MARPFSRVRPTDDERAAPLPGDDLLPAADVVMDRAFTLPAAPTQVWPWIAQLGKGRGRWYLPSGVEAVLPRRGRGLRHLDPRWQELHPGDVVPDYGRGATFEVALVDPPRLLVYTSERGHLRLTWAIVLDGVDGETTRVRLRLRVAGVRHRWLAAQVGGLFDLVTVAGLAAGLSERLRSDPWGRE